MSSCCALQEVTARYRKMVDKSARLGLELGLGLRVGVHSLV